jgi:hypothetical protein
MNCPHLADLANERSRVTPCANFSSLIVLLANVTYCPLDELAEHDRALAQAATEISETLSLTQFKQFRSVLTSLENLAEIVTEYAKAQDMQTLPPDDGGDDAASEGLNGASGSDATPDSFAQAFVSLTPSSRSIAGFLAGWY